MPFEKFEEEPILQAEDGEKELKEETESKELEQKEKPEEEMEKFEGKLKDLVGSERVGEIKEKAGENEGVSINSELLVSEFDGKEFIGKTVEEARDLGKEKLTEVSEEKRRTWEKYLQGSDDEIQQLLKKNEVEFIEFEKAREESLKWFIESDIKNIRLNNWHPESWLRWDNVEKGKDGEFKIDPRAEEIIDRLVKAGKNIDLVLAFGNKNYFGKENQYNIPSSEEEREAWKIYCGFMTEHFKGRIKRFEISSEPNAKPKGLGEKFTEGFPPNSNPELYGEVFGETAEAIKNKNPEAEIIFGNVALFDPEFIDKGLEKAKEYEERLRKEGKIGPDQHLIDYVGFHPYRKNPEAPSSTVKNGVGQFDKELDQAAREKYGYKSYDDQVEIYKKIVGKHYPNTRLINTEVGWHTEAPDEHSWVPDEKTQAEYTLKAAAIDASHGISANFFELFEKAVGEKNSLINKEGKPKEGLKSLETLNKYLESLKKQGGEKETPEEWVEKNKESLREQTSSIFSEFYKKVFPEKGFDVQFLNSEEFVKYCQKKNLPMPKGKKADQVFFNRLEEGNAMHYLINEDRENENIKLRLESSKKEGGSEKSEEVAERWFVKLGVHEIRHDVHREELIKPITHKSLAGFKELQKEYKNLSAERQKEGMPSSQIPEECDVMIIEQTIDNLWHKGIKDKDLLGKIVRNGDGPKIGAVSDLLKKKTLTILQLSEKIEEVMHGEEKKNRKEEIEKAEEEIKEVSFADLKRGDKLSVETLLGETINTFEITIIGKRKDGLRVIVRSEYGEEVEEFTARMPGGITMHRDGLTGYLKVEDDEEKNCLFFENLKDAKSKGKLSSAMRTTPIKKIILRTTKNKSF